MMKIDEDQKQNVAIVKSQSQPHGMCEWRTWNKLIL